VQLQHLASRDHFDIDDSINHDQHNNCIRGL